MKRRNFLAGAGVGAVAGIAFSAPAIAKQVRKLTMVTDWPEGPGVLTSARRLARTIEEASQGRIRIEVTPAGAVVRPFETFDAVQSGVADMFHSHIGYFEKKSQALHFFSGLPFGFSANELFAWVKYGGGQDVWDTLTAPFDIKPLLCSSTGSQMGGWFKNEINSPGDFKGLRYRMSSPGAEVLRRMGAIAVVVPGSDIVLSLESGAIEACEWIGPWMDLSMGLNKAAGFYYYPAWQEPGTALTLGINRQVWESFSEGDRRLIEIAAAGEYAISLAEFNSNNATALRQLRVEGTVKIECFNDAVLRKLREVSEEVVAEKGSADALSLDVYKSYTAFRELITGWTDIGEGAYLNTRGRRSIS